MVTDALESLDDGLWIASRALPKSLDAILAWDFDRVVVTHGSVLRAGGRARLEEAFAFLGARW